MPFSKEHSKNKIIVQRGLLENRSDLEYPSPTFIKHNCSNDRKGTNQAKLFFFCQFCLSYVKFFLILCFVNNGLVLSRSNLIFEIMILFLECSIQLIFSFKVCLWLLIMGPVITLLYQYFKN